MIFANALKQRACLLWFIRIIMNLLWLLFLSRTTGVHCCQMKGRKMKERFLSLKNHLGRAARPPGKKKRMQTKDLPSPLPRIRWQNLQSKKGQVSPLPGHRKPQIESRAVERLGPDPQQKPQRTVRPRESESGRQSWTLRTANEGGWMQSDLQGRSQS